MAQKNLNGHIVALARWQALAWAIANEADPMNDYATALGELYKTLSPAEQLLCRQEIEECRKAMRGETLAEIVGVRQ